MGTRTVTVAIAIAAAATTMSACGGANDDAGFETPTTTRRAESGTMPPDTGASESTQPSDASTLSPAQIADLEGQLDDIDELLQVVETDLAED